MDWITTHWQSLAAGALVAGTAAVFVVRMIRRRRLKPPCACGSGSRETSGGKRPPCSWPPPNR